MKKNKQKLDDVIAEKLPERLKWTPELVQRFWDGLSHTRLLEMSFSKLGGRSLIIAIDHLLTKNLRILDYGAGDGHLLKYLCERGLSAAAYEPSQERASVLQTFLKEYPNFIGVIDQNSEETFDVVIMAEVIEHILDEDIDNTLKRITKLIKDGGVLVITTPNNEDLELNMAYCPVSNQLFHRWQHVRSFTDESLSGLLEQYGMRELVTHKVEFNDSLFVPSDPVWGDRDKSIELPAYIKNMRLNKAVLLGAETSLLYIGVKDNSQ